MRRYTSCTLCLVLLLFLYMLANSNKNSLVIHVCALSIRILLHSTFGVFYCDLYREIIVNILWNVSNIDWFLQQSCSDFLRNFFSFLSTKCSSDYYLIKYKNIRLMLCNNNGRITKTSINSKSKIHGLLKFCTISKDIW